MIEYKITHKQAAYLNEVARMAGQYRGTLANLTTYAERELAALNGGYMGGGHHYQLMGEALVHQQELNTAIQMCRYVLVDKNNGELENLLQLAVTGKETFFMPEGDE